MYNEWLGRTSAFELTPYTFDFHKSRFQLLPEMKTSNVTFNLCSGMLVWSFGKIQLVESPLNFIRVSDFNG